jgi:hypothetical protein
MAGAKTKGVHFLPPFFLDMKFSIVKFTARPQKQGQQKERQSPPNKKAVHQLFSSNFRRTNETGQLTDET